MLKKLWGRIKCLFGKHARGVPDSEITPGGTRIFKCPRGCGAQWTRKVKPKA